MTGPQTEEQWRWAEALAFEKLWGADAQLRLTERIGVLALQGDGAGVDRMKKIATCLEQMVEGSAARGQ